MEVLVLKRQGLSQREIARKLGIHRKTVKKYLEHPELIGRYIMRKPRRSKLTPFVETIDSWLEEDGQYKATWIYDHLGPLGYNGSYEMVKRKARQMKEDMNRKAYIRFETEPGRQAQVDFGEFQVQRSDGVLEKYYSRCNRGRGAMWLSSLSRFSRRGRPTISAGNAPARRASADQSSRLGKAWCFAEGRVAFTEYGQRGPFPPKF